MQERRRIVAGVDAGPKVAIVVGVHGNEQIGLHAANAVVDALVGRPFSGELLILIANRPALAQNVRYIDHDLNRLWDDENVAAILGGTAAVSGSEVEELREVQQALADFFTGEQSSYLLDLHGTSSASAPFCLAFDHSLSRELTKLLSVPSITCHYPVSFWSNNLASHYVRRGVAATLFEAGPLNEPSSFEKLAACLWDSLAAIGVLPQAHFGEVSAARTSLRAATEDIPKTLVVAYEHAITPADHFVMKPGFKNFSPVHAGQHLADDQHGPVRAAIDGYLLFPLYQGQSDYGFAVGVVQPPPVLAGAALPAIEVASDESSGEPIDEN